MKNKLKNMVFMTTSKFSMIEIVLALIVVVIGIIGIIGLFPVGMKMQGEAAGKSYAGDAAEQFLRFNASKIAVNWNWINVFADSNPGTTPESWGNSPVVVFSSENMTIAAATGFSESQIISGGATYNGLFRLEQSSGDAVEFAAVLHCWKESSSDNGARLYVEISWPEAKPYPAREKATYNLEVFKAPETTINTAVFRNCIVYRSMGNGNNGYTAALLGVDEVSSGSYNVRMEVHHDGTSGLSAPEMSTFSIAGTTDGISDFAFDGGATFSVVAGGSGSGSGSGSILSMVSAAEVNGTVSDLSVVDMSGIGDGQATTFGIEYTLTGSLRDQTFSAGLADNQTISATFTDDDYIAVEGCTTVTVQEVASEEVAEEETPTPAPTVLEVVPASIIEPNTSTAILETPNGTVVSLQDKCPTIKCLGGSMSGYFYITAKVNVGGTWYEPWGAYSNPVGANLEQVTNAPDFSPGTVAAGTKIYIMAKSWKKSTKAKHMEVDSSNDTPTCWVLKDGDPAPTVAGWGDQADAAAYVQNYIDSTNHINLADNQAILLFELYTTNQSNAAFDSQDVVFLVTLDDVSSCSQ